MKLTLICTLLLLGTVSSFGQQTGPQPFSKQEYLEKSKRQKTIGTILLITGAGLITTGFIIPKGDVTNSGICTGPFWCGEKNKNDAIRIALGAAGGLVAIGSIPFFKLSKKNGQMAASVSLKIQNATNLETQFFTNVSFPALKMNVSF